MAFKLKSQYAVKGGGFKMMGSSPLKDAGHEGSNAPGHPEEHDYQRWKNVTESEGSTPGHKESTSDEPKMSDAEWTQFLKDNPGWSSKKKDVTYGHRTVEPIEPRKPSLDQTHDKELVTSDTEKQETDGDVVKKKKVKVKKVRAKGKGKAVAKKIGKGIKNLFRKRNKWCAAYASNGDCAKPGSEGSIPNPNYDQGAPDGVA
tara:strand:- start:13 stop:618 length:606 start_codon:yes stop_codon:yes gene_type:complete